MKKIVIWILRLEARLALRKYRPEIVDSTHLVVYVGGRMYHVLDYPIRLVAGDRNEGSHGNFPYAGEWEAALLAGGVAGLTALAAFAGLGVADARRNDAAPKVGP